MGERDLLHLGGDRHLEVERQAALAAEGGEGVDVGAPLVALATLDVPAFPADNLPANLAAIPVEDPGSRRLAAHG